MALLHNVKTIVKYRNVEFLFSLSLTHTHTHAHTHSGESQELHVATASTPSIVVVTPEDTEHLIPSVLRDSHEPRITLSFLPPELTHTARPSL